VSESLAEKGGVFVPVHLARGHRKGAMMDRAEATRVTIDRHIVGRVGEDHCGTFLAQQHREGRGIEGIAAQDTMAAEGLAPHRRADGRRPQRLWRVEKSLRLGQGQCWDGLAPRPCLNTKTSSCWL